MIEATPSMMKNAMSTSVSDSAPTTGDASSASPARMPMSTDVGDHQNPGACRAQIVVIRPTAPLIKNNQPMRMVKASVAISGTRIATMPRMTRTIPSIRNSTQCSWIALATVRPMRCASLGWFIVMAGSRKL